MKSDELFARSNKIIIRNYMKYLFPALLVGLGGALQHFVDTIIVANLLDSDAIVIGNYAGPLVQFTSFTVKLIGCGGAVLYATLLGRMEKNRASEIYSTVMIFTAVLSLFVTVMGMLFVDPLAEFLGCGKELMESFRLYLIPTIILIPVNIIVMTFAAFLPSMGYPGLTSKIVLTANLSNILFDFIYIKFFKMGISGAQWATISGYLIALIFLLVKLVNSHFVFPPIRYFDLSLMKDVCMRGLPQGLSQLGLIVYFVYFNRLVTRMGGISSMKAFSVCIQLLAVLSIVINGVSANVRNFVSILNSAQDKKSIRHVMKRSILILELWGVILLLVILLFPDLFVDIYNINDGRAEAVHALRMYSFITLFKGMVILFRDYLTATGRPYHAMLLTTVEGSAMVIILGTILGHKMGPDGVWISFPLTSCVCCAAVFMYLFLCEKKHGIFKDDCREKMYLTLPVVKEEPVLPVQEIEAYYKDKAAKDVVRKTALLVEEMYIYSSRHTKNLDYIDVMITISNTDSRILFRSLGEPFAPMGFASEKERENVLVLKKIASEIKYEYICGMNTTSLRVAV